MGQKFNVVILLTGTINPGGMINTKLQNPEKRKAQYLEAIKYYLDNTAIPIVFCENSNYDIFNEIQSKHKNKRLEYLSYEGNKGIEKRGKSYGEANIILYAYENSRFIKNCKYIIKVTGRIKIININKLILRINKNNNYNSFYGHFLYPYQINSVCFALPQTILINIIIKYKEKLDDINYIMENLIYEGLNNYTNVKFKIIVPILEGISGTFNKFYKLNSTYIKEHHNLILMETYFILSNFYKSRQEYFKSIKYKIYWFLYALKFKLLE